MIQNHRNQLIDIDDMITSEKDRLLNFRSSEENEARIMFERAQLIKKAEVERRRALASENIARIREELAARVKLAESQWQAKASKWLVMAKRKVEVKKREDEEARAGKRKRGGK
jgi:type I restriction-modification system DNA methylase subunit